MFEQKLGRDEEVRQVFSEGGAPRRGNSRSKGPEEKDWAVWGEQQEAGGAGAEWGVRGGGGEMGRAEDVRLGEEAVRTWGFTLRLGSQRKCVCA